MEKKSKRKTVFSHNDCITRNSTNELSSGIVTNKLEEKRVDRRMFLKNAGTLGVGAAVVASSSPVLGTVKPETPNNEAVISETQAPYNRAVLNDRGKVLNIRSEIKEYKDSRTGARIRRLTGDGSNNVHPYFTGWSNIGEDSNRIIFRSDRSGMYQYYMLEISTSKLIQLTSGENIRSGVVAKGGQLFYFQGLVLRSVNIDTLKDRELYKVPEGYSPTGPTCTEDGKFIAFSYVEQTNLSTQTGRIYSTMHERYYQFPHSVIMRVNSENGEAVAVWGEKTNANHVNIHPTDPDIILFAHEGGSTCVMQRMWVVNYRDKQMRQAIPLYPQRKGESVVHEYFTLQGDVGTQYTLQSERGTEQFNLFLRPDNTWIRQYRFPGSGRPGHISSNSDNTLIIGDGAYIGGPEDKEGRNFLGLMTHENGLVKARRLAWHGSSWLTQNSHPHPRFSTDDKWVIYNSDAEKCDNVYMVEVDSL